MSPFSLILIKDGGNKMEEIKGNVFNIQRYTIHDGPGIRTEVFLKGCPLSCKWCSNPEGLHLHSELGVYPSKCIGKDVCGDCIKACPLEGKPIVFGEDNKLSSLRRDICLGCLSCTKVCFPKALKRWGDPMTVKEVMDVVYADRSYFESSGGGVTLNGGEVMVQWKFALAILKECKKNGINTCVETTMLCDQERLDAIYPYVDLMITDMKSMDTQVHKKYCGAGNEKILVNIKHTVEMGIPLVIRIPVIPDVNNSEENIRATSEFIANELGNHIVQVQLLPYRKMGTEKYDSLQLEYPMGEDYKMPEREVWEKNLLELAAIMQSYGVPAAAGSSTKLQIKKRPESSITLSCKRQVPVV